MSNKAKQLLDRYTGNIEVDCGAFARLKGCRRADDTLHIAVDRIVPDPDQPRREFDEEDLYALAGSLRARGQLQPIRVRYDVENDRYIVIAGERRLRAAKIAELETIQAVVDDRDPDRLVTQLSENLQRRDLLPIEQAEAFKQLMDVHKINGKELAERLNVSVAKVSRALALLELPDDVKDQVNAGELRGAAVRELTKKRTRKSKAPTSHKIKVGPATVTVTRRKSLTAADVVGILEAAIDQLRERKEAA